MADDQVITRARELGWRPLPADPEHPTQDEFKGDAAKFVEPEEYIERGERVLPIVREHNKKLEAELRQTQADLRESLELQRASAEAIQALKTSHEADVQRQVDLTRKRILEEIKAARENGDVDKEFELRDDLEELPAAKSKEAPPAKPAAKAPAYTPEFLAWQVDNDWYGKDMRKTALADGIAVELRNDSKNATLIGRPFYDAVGAEIEAYLNPTRKQNKVEGGGGNSFGGPKDDSGGVGKTYADLPAEAKAQCKLDVKALVGKGRAYATEAEYQKQYAEQYFRYN